jgi:hypothetical protein
MASMRGTGALAILALLASTNLRAGNGIVTYQALNRFELSGITVRADNLVLQRVRPSAAGAH